MLGKDEIQNTKCEMKCATLCAGCQPSQGREVEVEVEVEVEEVVVKVIKVEVEVVVVR